MRRLPEKGSLLGMTTRSPRQGTPTESLEDRIPDVRDGLTRRERIVLYVLHETQKERDRSTAEGVPRSASGATREGRSVPTAMLWGRVCEHFYISPEELSLMLARLGARKN
jgi:hypothetical protein